MSHREMSCIIHFFYYHQQPSEVRRGLPGPQISPCNNTAPSHRMLISYNILLFLVPWHLDPLCRLIAASKTVFSTHIHVVSLIWGLCLSLLRWRWVAVVLLGVPMQIWEHSFVTVKAESLWRVKDDKKCIYAGKKKTTGIKRSGKMRTGISAAY